MLITAARGFGQRITSLLFRSMLMGQQRRARRIGTRAPWKSDGDVSRWIERVEDRTLLSASIPLSGTSWTALGPAPITNGQTPGGLAVTSAFRRRFGFSAACSALAFSTISPN